jgi:hypothetical protein
LAELKSDAIIISQVFVDDFMNGLAGLPNRESKSAQELWLTQAAMHSIHAVFPPPEILNHQGGKDSISQKKVDKGDAKFQTEKEMLGVMLRGALGSERLVGLPLAKRDKYVGAIQEALDSPAHRVGLNSFQKIVGKLQFAAQTLPAMWGFFTPLYQAMLNKGPREFVGLGKRSEVRESLSDLITMLNWAHEQPSHITELVPSHAPHFYGTVDASSVGFGGTFLPCTTWIAPTVWRLEMPVDLRDSVRNGQLTMVDCEFAGYFIWNCMLVDRLEAEGIETAGMNSHCLSDNSPTVGIVNRQASRAKSPMPSRTLRWLAMRQRFYRLGPQSVAHVAGAINTMADFPSRSYEQGFGPSADAPFALEFSHRYPLPPQLGSWKLARPRDEICSAAFLLLRKIKDGPTLVNARSGDFGVNLPQALANTLTCSQPKKPTNTWNEASCSWPLVQPCGRVSSEGMDQLLGRKLSERFAHVDRYWQIEDLRTLGDEIRAKPI